ncbi:DUF2461 domain-containing protein [Roseibium sp. FZY0029]|uniref:DUF2461 domain-containing protein n=1 Tax=Roseibium sp. FZY0029 TaxID=3116647 RepID=UPI002EB14FBD|nr:DUF2461 domain-containing protein [Roseibium sp. FZY0029]
MSASGFRPETFRFLEELAANNSREWFEAHKTDYQRFIKEPAEAVRESLADSLSRLSKHDLTSKQFRMNRDLRFSKDKTPYNPHIRMAFWPNGAAFQGKDAQPPSFFLSVESDHVRTGTGCMQFSKPVLGTYLQRLEAREGEDIERLIGQVTDAGFDLSEPDLAKPPRGFPANHPRKDLARHKGLAVWRDLRDIGSVQGPDGHEAIAEAIEPALPFWGWLMSLHAPPG